MKKILLICFCLIGLTTVTMAQTKPAEFKFEKETHDYGKITIGTPATFEFKFTNIGDEDLLITKTETTSGTVASFTQSSIPKGGSGIIKVTFSPTGEPMPFSKTIKIISNSKTPTKVLYIKGETVK
ncbi:DUF1573 domain-containing protein [Pedobacter flavus]|uniref:DUF1573 domain-containing protein n=1 Tax=Pedobacter flavus TaxID=3113906 RepID=A0ABU7H272_9SPHI|nr:DUF1573 domain-containing protein [Pedobacter sp. VNH31]MEE1885417.1 DUF1573 domain-containing protein [Pedobacter sp. VNH31]